MTIKKQYFLAILLVLLWLLYVFYRIFNGLSLISDEYFYVHQYIGGEKKRLIFLQMVQFFPDDELAFLGIVVVNVIALIVSYFLLSSLFHNDYVSVFLYLLYFSAIASYIFRDTLLLLLVSLAIYILTKNSFFISSIKFSRIHGLPVLRKHFTLQLLFLVAILYLIYDFRPQYLGFIVIAWAAAVLAGNIKKNYVVLGFIVMVIALLSTYSVLILNSYSIYGISLSEYLGTREDRWGMTMDSGAFIYSLLTHYFAPIPFSLVVRILDSDLHTIYGVLDDLYRLVYKTFIYYVFVYILINFHYLKNILRRWRLELFFLTTFSLANAVGYSLFSFGQGHERIKIMSTLFLIFIYSGIRFLKKERALRT